MKTLGWWRATTAPLALAALFAGIPLAAPFAGTAHAQAPETVHGENSEFRGPTLKLVWGVLRGASEEATQVVIRVTNVTGAYQRIRVDGVDPFTKDRVTQVPLRPLGRETDVVIPRGRFAAHPSTEFALFRTEEDARANHPALVVYYLGVPDTAPEFADRAKLEAHLGAMTAK